MMGFGVGRYDPRPSERLAYPLYRTFGVNPVMSLLNNPAFWDRKVRIALLTLATFIALC